MPRAVWNGHVIAESDDVAVVDGYTYFPVASVRKEHLRPSTHTSVCGWKGTASYYDVVAGDDVNEQAAFEYREPSEAATEAGVKAKIAFWRGVKVE